MIDFSIIDFVFIDKEFIISYSFLYILIEYRYKLKLFNRCIM